jgi:pyrroline-5-carboxylate reductase
MTHGKLTIIGGGNMGGAILHGLMREGARPGDVHLVEIRDTVRAEFEKRYGISTSETIGKADGQSGTVILAVKPQNIRETLTALRPHINEKALVLSVAAGISLASIGDMLSHTQPVARTMPNIAAKVGASAVAMCYNAHITKKQKELSRKIMSAIGMVVEVDENDMDAVTGLSGSGPAFVFLMIEALADGGVLKGLPREIATKLAIQTVYGSASMLRETEEHPALLREQVTSPGGTTAEGLLRLEQGGFKHLLIDAVRAAAEKSSDLGR